MQIMQSHESLYNPYYQDPDLVSHSTHQSWLDMEARESDEIATNEQLVQLTYMTDIEVFSEDFPLLPALLAKKQKTKVDIRDKDHHFSSRKM